MQAALVALLAEGVDRNPDAPHALLYERVALLAEGVDRNPLQTPGQAPAGVALLAEGVDRNRLISRKLTSRASRPPRRGRG